MISYTHVYSSTMRKETERHLYEYVVKVMANWGIHVCTHTHAGDVWLQLHVHVHVYYHKCVVMEREGERVGTVKEWQGLILGPGWQVVREKGDGGSEKGRGGASYGACIHQLSRQHT